MMTYTVFISSADGSGRIDLSSGSDSEKASDLARALVGNAEGESFQVGVEIAYKPDAPTTPAPEAPAARVGVSKK